MKTQMPPATETLFDRHLKAPYCNRQIETETDTRQGQPLLVLNQQALKDSLAFGKEETQRRDSPRQRGRDRHRHTQHEHHRKEGALEGSPSPSVEGQHTRKGTEAQEQRQKIRDTGSCLLRGSFCLYEETLRGHLLRAATTPAAPVLSTPFLSL